jgi:hypothetical protein
LRAKDAVKCYYPELMRQEKFLMTKHFLSSARNAQFDYQKEKGEKDRRGLIQRREADEMKQKEREQLIGRGSPTDHSTKV